MKNIYVLLIPFFFNGVLQAQNIEGQMSVDKISVGLFGNLSLFSINYERNTKMRKNYFTAFQVGLGYNEEFILDLFGTNIPREPKKYLTIPFQVTGNFGRYPNFLEAGIGATLVGGEMHPYPIIGFRRQSDRRFGGGFKIFATFPFTVFNGFEYDVKDDIDYIIIPFGISFGLNI